MDNMKFDGSILAKGFVIGWGSVTQKPDQAQRILPMIEQRIRDDVEPKARQAEKDLTAIISIELRKLGINPNLTNMHQFTSGIADKYRERLVSERIEALVDSLVPAALQPVKDSPEPPASPSVRYIPDVGSA
jgi:hypothetical protein